MSEASPSEVQADDVAVAWVHATLGIMLLVVVLCIPLVDRLSRAFGYDASPTVAPIDAKRRQAPGEPPRLQVEPRGDRLALQREAEARLHSFGYVDRQHGVVHVPIERAMQRAARGSLS
jgi:hypothetical protein